MNVRWVEMENPPGKKMPKWKRTAGISDTGVVFIPAGALENEMNVVLCAGYDGTTLITYLNHVYVPSQWMAKEFPKTADVCRLIESSVLTLG